MVSGIARWLEPQQADADPKVFLQEAVAEWEERQAERQAPTRPQHSPAEAAARILELRKGNMLPAGATIKDLINYGRA